MSTAPDPDTETPTDVGPRLRAAREAKQLSLGQIADATKILIGTLEAVETHDVAQLPGGIFTRGVVRAYAAEVGLDPEHTLRDFMAQVPSESTAAATYGDWQEDDGGLLVSLPRIDEPSGALAILKRWPTLWLVSVAVVAVLFSLWTLYPRPSAGEAPLALVSDADPALSSRPTTPLGGDPLLPSEPVPRLTDPGTPAAPASVVASAVTAPGPLATLTIVLRASRECWVSLRVDGQLVVRHVMQPDDSETHRADEEIVLSVGDAGALAFSINQQNGRPLGASGEVKTVRITPDNYRDYVR